MVEEIADMSSEELEEWFVTGLSETPLSVGEMLEALRRLHVDGESDLCRDWAELLRDTLVEQKDAAGMLMLMHCMVAVQGDGDGVAQRTWILDGLKKVFRDRLHSRYLESVGFDDDIAMAECLRRLSLLMQLDAGTLCRDRTWGFGVVRRVDDFYRKVEIDFARKPGHEMSFAYASETLELLDEEHVLAQQYREPEHVREMAETSPHELVKLVLKSYGPLAAPRLQEIMTESLVEEGTWKAFWERARKGLKADPYVDMPSRRNVPIRLIAGDEEYLDRRVGALREERDPVRILELVKQLDSEAGMKLDDAAVRIVDERIRFALVAAEGQRSDLTARVLLTVRRLKHLPVVLSPGEVEAQLDKLMSRKPLLDIAVGLPVRDFGALLELMLERDGSAVEDLVLECVNELPFGCIEPAVALLRARGRENDFFELCRSGQTDRSISEGILLWLCLDLDMVESKAIARVSEICSLAVDALEFPQSGERLKCQNRLREIFADRAWLADTLGCLEESERSALLKRIRDSRGWETSDKRSVLAAMIRVDPELEKVIAAGGTAGKEAATGRYTSWRSYREREQQLKKLVEVDIPQNSREIAVARSYGDLSENHEYKAAKEHQGILLRRRGELERELEDVQGTDFTGCRTDSAGMGTEVVLEGPGGEQRVVRILGEWDRDQTLNIISSNSRLAAILDGAAEGDWVMLPHGETEGREERCRILSIGVLPPAVREWVGTS